MTETEIIIRIFLAIIFGAVLGLETETREADIKGKRVADDQESQRIGGIRTYTVISLAGAISGLLFNEGESTLVYMIFGSVIALVISAYILNVQWKHAFGMTTEIAILITFLLGFVTTSMLLELSVILVILVMLTFFLSQKRGIGLLVHQIEHREIIDVIKFGLVALVILPLLPNESYSVINTLTFLNIQNSIDLSLEVQNFVLINPFSIWLIIVLVSGLNLAGYLLSKFIGTKGSIVTTGLLGGLVSSTSTTIALANKTKESKQQAFGTINAGAALLANAVSFFQISLVILISNRDLFIEIMPAIVAMTVIGLLVGTFFITTVSAKKTESFELSHQPFSIVPAIKFVSVIVILKILIQIAQLSSIQNLFTFVTAISGFTGLDAPTIAVADLSLSGSISTNAAITAILLANAVNFGAKIFYSYTFGSKQFAKTVTIGLLITMIGSLAVLV